jgi:phenylacetate-coenzyme A ligase PaaK-like adenylate-forming protein
LEQLQQVRRADIEALQLHKLNAVLEREKLRDGFYRALPNHLSSLAQLSDLPFTTEEQLARAGQAMVLTSQADIQRIITDQTSGTTGRAKRVYYSSGDCRRTVGFFAAGLGELVYPDSRVLICMPFSGPNGLGDLIAQAIEALGAVPIRAGVGLTLGEYAHILVHERPDSYVGMPVLLLSLLRFCGPHTLRRALVSGDVLAATVEAAIRSYGISLYPHYGSREMALGGAVTCPAQAGMHVRENHIIAEIIGPDGQVLPAGTYGELVITTIGMEAMPLIRYRTGDWTRIIAGTCPCGSELLRLDHISRADRRMEQWDNIFFAYDGLLDYQVTLKDHKIELQVLRCGDKDGAAELDRCVEAAWPGQDVKLIVHTASGAEGLFYKGKRVAVGGSGG